MNNADYIVLLLDVGIETIPTPSSPYYGGGVVSIPPGENIFKI